LAAALCPLGDGCSLGAAVFDGSWWRARLESMASLLASDPVALAWLAALALFLALNFVSRPLVKGTNRAPRGWTARTMGVLFFVCAAGVAYFVGSLLASSGIGIAAEVPHAHRVALDAAGAAASFVLLLGLVRFVLTKF
jgi:hypothetical protein